MPGQTEHSFYALRASFLASVLSSCVFEAKDGRISEELSPLCSVESKILLFAAPWLVS
jgi:hypothetical protein